MLIPKTSGTRCILPRAASGSEPTGADAGTLSFDDVLDKVRVKLSSGWTDLGSGGGGVTSLAVNAPLSESGATGAVTLSMDLHTQTSKASPVGADEILIADSAASFAPKRATLTSIAGLFTSGVSSFNGRTGAVVPTSGDYTASQVGLSSVTNDAQLKRSAGDFSTFTTKATPAAADVVLIEDSAAAGAKKAATLSSLASAIIGTSSFDPATLSPLHRWRASVNSQTGGLVDSLTDTGSSVKSFTASGSNRCAVGTDGLGNTYLDMAGASIYSAGASTDWAFLSNGTAFTILVVMSKPTWVTNTFSALLATMTYSSSGSGMRLEFGQQTNSGGGPSPLGGSEFGIYAGSGRILLPSYQASPPTTVQAYVWQYNGYSKAQQSGEFSSITLSSTLLNDFRLWQQGRQAVNTQHNSTGSFASTCDTALTLGAFGSGSGFSKLTGRVYEIIILNRCIGDQHVLNFFDYASTTYGATV